MIVPNLPLLLLNSSAVSNLTLPPHPPDDPSNTVCFVQTSQPEEPLLKTTYADCWPAMRLIAVGDKINAPIYFSRDPEVGYKLPNAWAHGTCVIEIDVDPPNEGDITTMVEIAKGAIEISMLCIEEWPNLGGRHRVGEKQVLIVFMFGRLAPENKLLPQINRNLSIGHQGPVRKTLAHVKGG